MKSWIRLACWFSAAFLIVSILFVLLSYRVIEGHFPQRQSPDGQSSATYYAGHAGGSSDDTYWSRRDITRLQALYGLAMLAVIWGVAYLAGRGTDRSIRSLNEQLEVIDPARPDRKLELEETNEEIVVLKNHINELLTRMQMSILNLKQHAARVAHELRAPLTILRLKIEQAADKVEPRLAEEIQSELLRLNLHVEQALLVARAEQGHLIVSPSRFNLDALLNDSLEDFRLLGQDQNREFIYRGHEAYVSADSKYTKQIFYNLLTNALRHGTGPVQLRLRSTSKRVLVWIANQAKAPTPDQLDLGLGKRIVNALVNSHSNMSIQSRRYHGLYVVRLSFES